MVTTQKEARLRMRVLPLAGNQSLLVLKCPQPQCEKGLLVGAIGSQHIGIVSAGCIDCDNAMDFYVHSGEHKAWLMQPIEMETGRAAARK